MLRKTIYLLAFISIFQLTSCLSLPDNSGNPETNKTVDEKQAKPGEKDETEVKKGENDGNLDQTTLSGSTTTNNNENVQEQLTQEQIIHDLYLSYTQFPCDSTLKEDKEGYIIENGCLYYNSKLQLNGNLNKVIAGENPDFYNIKNWGESAGEWFRLKDNNKLRIFLISNRGCGGCMYTGPYLEINIISNDIKTKFADLPYAGTVINSKNNRYGVFLDNKKPTKLFVYDYLNLKNNGEIYDIPKESNLEICTAGGCHIPETVLKWIDNRRIQLHPLKSGVDESVYDENNFYGDPFVINVY